MHLQITAWYYCVPTRMAKFKIIDTTNIGKRIWVTELL